MDRLSRFLLRHRLVVGLCWLAVLVVGIATAGTVSGRLATNFSLPGAKSYETNQAILRLYGNGGDTRPLVPVVTLPAGTTVDSPGVRATLDRSFGAVARDPRLRVVSWASTGDRAFVSADGRTTFGLVFTPPTGRGGPDLGPAVATAMGGALPPAATLRVTGFDELSAGDGGGGTGVLTETLLGGLGALAVLAFVFGSLLALVPLLIAAVSILATFLVILGSTTFTEVNFIVQFLVAPIGLGVAIDYSLLLVTRWREELAHGHSVEEAVHLAMASAGRAVILSGVTVAIGLLALVLLPVPFLRSVGFGGMLIPLVSVLVAVTLLPVLLATVGRRLDWPRPGPLGRGARRRRDPGRSRCRRARHPGRRRQGRHPGHLRPGRRGPGHALQGRRTRRSAQPDRGAGARGRRPGHSRHEAGQRARRARRGRAHGLGVAPARYRAGHPAPL